MSITDNKNNVFQENPKMRISRYEIFFCQSVMYSMQTGENHNVNNLRYEIFFCQSAIYSIQSANNHNVNSALTKD